MKYEGDVLVYYVRKVNEYEVNEVVKYLYIIMNVELQFILFYGEESIVLDVCEVVEFVFGYILFVILVLLGELDSVVLDEMK